MEINLEELFIEQDKLNKVIFEKHNITSYNEVLNELVLALYVEIGELANEIRSFKY
jgi:dimeric dUTPase (all-alpha-NTP-PPase superfamily)